MEAKLPSGRIMAAAAYAEPFAYIFGGQDMESILDEIIRYDTSSDTAELMSVRLPDVRMGCSAVTVGDSIYVMGGRNVTGHVSTVFLFNPANGTVREVARLPAPGGGRVVVWDGERILMFGGCGVNCASSDIFQFDPETGESRQLDISMPTGVYWTTGVWTGEQALILGGNDWSATVDDIVVYTPGDGDGSIEVVGHLPKPLEAAASFWSGSAAYVLGGVSTLDPSDSIYVISKGVGGSGGSSGDDAIPLEWAALALAAVVMVLCWGGGKRRRGKFA
jgi:hypothetical protein